MRKIYRMTVDQRHTKHGLDFFGLALLDECVKDDDVLALAYQVSTRRVVQGK
jgi:hypothetical protein